MLKSVTNTLLPLVGRPFFNFSGGRHSYQDYLHTLQNAGASLEKHFAAKSDTEFNRRVLNHIIGIERWSQSRLQVGLGHYELKLDEYDTYRPPRETAWVGLQTEFKTTRQATLALIHELDKAQIPLHKIVPHNMYGDLTLGGWLAYINTHANLEAKKMR